MTNSILTPLYLNGAIQLTTDIELKEFLQKTRNQAWVVTNKDNFNEILTQRIYEPARNVIKHFEDGCYESSIVMCGAVAEMLTYFLFFVHTDSIKIISDDCDVSHSRFDRIKSGIGLYKKNSNNDKGSEDKILKNSFGERGDQSTRIKILANSKITTEDYHENGLGHDIKEICLNLDKIHKIRIRYFHHWFYEEEEKVKNDARECIKSLYKTIGYILECDSSMQTGTLMINSSIARWVDAFSN